MNYNGDSLEDVTANETFYKILKEDSLYGMHEEFIAGDYFKEGWEAAMKFAREYGHV